MRALLSRVLGALLLATLSLAGAGLARAQTANTGPGNLGFVSSTLDSIAPPVKCAEGGPSFMAADYNNADLFTNVPPSTTANWLKSAQGIADWALVLSGQRVVIPKDWIQAYPSQETSYIKAGNPSQAFPNGALWLISQHPSCLIYDSGATNNILHDPTGATTGSFTSITNDIRSVFDAAKAAKVRVIVLPIPPRDPTIGSLTAWTSAQYNMVERVNTWIVNYSANSAGWVYVANANPDLTNSAAVGAKPKTGYTGDGTHDWVPAAYYQGKAVAAVLTQLYPPVNTLPTNNLTWSATSPNANLLTNGMMAGTAGTCTTQCTGTAPDTWTVTGGGTGITCASSIVTSAITGEPMLQIVMTGSYTVSGSTVTAPTYAFFCRFFFNIPNATVAGLTYPATIENLCAVEWDAGNGTGAFPSLEFRWNGSSNFHNDLFKAPGVLPNEAWSGKLRTLPKTFATNPGSNVLSFFGYVFAKSYPDGSYTANQTVRFGQCTERVVDSVVN